MRRIDPAALRHWIEDGRELAILDAREEGEFGAGHLLWAALCQLSRRELRVPVLLPRRDVRVVCVDGGERGLADRLAGYLASLGYTDVSVLEGGTPAWEAAGYVLFTGINVPSKAFGEWVEHHYGTESVDAAELNIWRTTGRKMVILDSRPIEEFRRMSIPGAIDVPGGELVYRIGDLAPDPATLVVVNCAGRTRSILGAESLRQAGIPNRVLALRNGTMGWELAGLACDRGSEQTYPPGTPKSLGLALARATAFAETCGVGVIGPLDLARFEQDPRRTAYVLDVRDPAEYRAGHRPGSINAPGGQLVQATDRWIAVRGARVALIDDTGVRARMTAGWLRQMGFADVFVVDGGLEEEQLAQGRPSDSTEAPMIAATALAEHAARHRVAVVDVARSVDFREGHIPGSVWGLRTRLERLREHLAAAEEVVATSPDGVLALLALAELRGLTAAPVSALEGGTRAWSRAGLDLAVDRAEPPDDACVDVYLRPYDRNAGVAAAMRDYLGWEIDLPQQVARDGTAHFSAANGRD